jgi:hypothetical protein
VPVTTPFQQDREHAAYDADAVTRFWRVLDWTDAVVEEFAGWSCAKTSPVHLFWHSFDLAVTRFGGKRAPALPAADAVTREAYSHEVASFGFWDAAELESSFCPPPGRAERSSPPTAEKRSAPSSVSADTRRGSPRHEAAAAARSGGIAMYAELAQELDAPFEERSVEERAVQAWRRREFVRAGFCEAIADVLADCLEVDLERVRGIVAAGCAPALATRILL